MSTKVYKRNSKRIKEELKESYELIFEDGAYYIVTTEYDAYGDQVGREIACLNTSDKKKAMKIYSLLVKNNACVGTIKDIIMDLMC